MKVMKVIADLLVAGLGTLLAIGVPVAWIHFAYGAGRRPTLAAFLLLSGIAICLGWALIRLIDPHPGPEDPRDPE
jgi:hypothetical protein